KDLPSQMQSLGANELAEFENGLLRRAQDGQLKLQVLEVRLNPPIAEAASPAAVTRLDHLTLDDNHAVYAILAADGKLRMFDVVRKRAPGRKFKMEVTTGELPLGAPGGKKPPDHVLLSGVGDNAYAVWDDGTLFRFNTRDLEKPELAE